MLRREEQMPWGSNETSGLEQRARSSVGERRGPYGRRWPWQGLASLK